MQVWRGVEAFERYSILGDDIASIGHGRLVTVDTRSEPERNDAWTRRRRAVFEPSLGSLDANDVAQSVTLRYVRFSRRIGEFAPPKKRRKTFVSRRVPPDPRLRSEVP